MLGFVPGGVVAYDSGNPVFFSDQPKPSAAEELKKCGFTPSQIKTITCLKIDEQVVVRAAKLAVMLKSVNVDVLVELHEFKNSGVNDDAVMWYKHTRLYDLTQMECAPFLLLSSADSVLGAIVAIHKALYPSE
jgi:hypothetical protein